jgi:hypothetical protein
MKNNQGYILHQKQYLMVGGGITLISKLSGVSQTTIQLGIKELNTGLKLHINHLPAGTSKWNKIEHRLFSHISINWHGKPLISLAVIISLINATKTRLKVTAKLDDTEYKTGIKISDEEFEKINIKRYKFHGEWNYIIQPN